MTFVVTYIEASCFGLLIKCADVGFGPYRPKLLSVYTITCPSTCTYNHHRFQSKLESVLCLREARQ